MAFRRKIGTASKDNSSTIIWVTKEENEEYNIQFRYNESIFNLLLKLVIKFNVRVKVKMIDIQATTGTRFWHLPEERYYNNVQICGNLEELGKVIKMLSKQPFFKKTNDLDNIEMDYVLKELEQ